MRKADKTPKPAEVAGRLDGLVGPEHSAARRAEYWKAEKLAADTEICSLLNLAACAYNSWYAGQHVRVRQLLRAMVDGEFRRTYRPDLYGPSAVLSGAANEVKPRRDV